MEEVTEQAYSSAESLLKGYKLQDRRMDLIIEGKYQEAREAEQKALYEMAEAFEFEFPDSNTGRQAGKRFMEASFIQDEIENWNQIRTDEEALQQARVSTDYGENHLMQDERWSEVRHKLEQVCQLTGIDEEYIDPKLKFLKLHEVGDSRYRKFAQEAEQTKIRSMIADQNEDKAQELTNYFLRGVEKHDNWDQKEQAQQQAVDIVAEYYQKIMQLR